MAIQYGMPLDEFWHGDIRLLEAYQKAYIRDKSYTAWINGAYIFEANTAVSQNANRTKKSDPVAKYNDWKDPIVRHRRKMTDEELDEAFRKQQADLNNWLFHK